MNDDDLRQRLAALDPHSGAVSPVSGEPFTSLRAQNLLESVMSTPDPSSRRRPVLLAAAASVTVAAAVGGVLLLQGSDAPDPAPQATAPLTLALSQDDPFASCMVFSPDDLKTQQSAFAATATSVTPTAVTLDVERWYVGGDASTVVLTQPGGASAPALTGVAFVEGERYLVSAAEGQVVGCGYSGAATPDFEAAFDKAFPRS